MKSTQDNLTSLCHCPYGNVFNLHFLCDLRQVIRDHYTSFSIAEYTPNRKKHLVFIIEATDSDYSLIVGTFITPKMRFISLSKPWQAKKKKKKKGKKGKINSDSRIYTKSLKKPPHIY